jgi:hypothetical protein
VRMENLAEAPELVLEAVQCHRVEMPKRFQRNPLVALAIEGFVNHTHSAGPDVPNERKPLGAVKYARIVRHDGTVPFSTIDHFAANICRAVDIAGGIHPKIDSRDAKL